MIPEILSPPSNSFRMSSSFTSFTSALQILLEIPESHLTTDLDFTQGQQRIGEA
jgi:hypothetical protein